MKYLYIIILLLVCNIAFADEIIFQNGKVIKVKIKSITLTSIYYIQENDSTRSVRNIPRSGVEKIRYTDGSEVIIPQHSISENKTEEKVLPEADSIQPNDINQSNDLPVDDSNNDALAEAENDPENQSLIRLTTLANLGYTKVNIYDKNKDKIASGDGELKQYMIMASFDSSDTGFYISPDLGYFYRKISVQDYSYNVDSSNSQIEGFIPGIVTNPSTGEVVSKNSVSSLAYNATFHSFFLDLKAGGTMICGPRGVKFTINPYIYAGLIDLRKTEFEFKTFSGSEKFASSFKFNYFGSFGTGVEGGMYFPTLKLGWQIGYDFRYMRKFEIPSGVIFKEVYDDTELGIKRTRENSAKYTDLYAHLITLSLYYCF